MTINYLATVMQLNHIRRHGTIPYWPTCTKWINYEVAAIENQNVSELQRDLNHIRLTEDGNVTTLRRISRNKSIAGVFIDTKLGRVCGRRYTTPVTMMSLINDIVKQGEFKLAELREILKLQTSHFGPLQRH